MDIHARLSFVILITIVSAASGALAAPVAFNDTALLGALTTQWEAATGLTLSDPPEDTELANPLFTTLNAKNLGITDLTGLEACTSLTYLNLGLNQISDLAPLSGLTGLVNLDLGFGSDPLQDTDDFDPLQTGTNLITDISPLGGLVNLEYLSLMGNEGITSIAAISTMDSLAQLWIASSPIADFSPLSDVSDTLMFLGEINCSLQQSDIAILNGLTQLQGLGILAESNITDVSGLTGINPSMVFALMMVPVTDISVIANYINLQMLQINMTQVTTLPDLSGLTSLQQAGFEENDLTDISGLAGLTGLQQLNLRRNDLADISALASCTGLKELDLSENQLTDIQPLLDNTGIGAMQWLNIEDNAFLEGTPFCDENQLDQLQALAPSLGVNQNAICGTAVNLSISLNGAGDTEPEPGTHPVLQGAYQYLNAYPINGSGQAFSHWSGDLSSTNLNDTIFMDTDKTVTANFVPGDWTLTINKTGASGGRTWPEPGVYSYLDGQNPNVSVNTNDSPNAYFNGWAGDVSGFQNNINVLMDGSKTVTADFVSSGYELTLNIQGQGGINGFWNNSQPYKYAAGANFNLEAYSWSSMYRFDHWEGDIGTGVDPYNSVLPITMDMNRAITAVFVEDYKVLTIIIDGPGSTNPAGSPDPGTNYNYTSNQSACINALLGSGTAFDHWEGDIGSASSTWSSICVVMDQDRTITAHFVEADWDLTLQATGNGTTNPEPGVYGYINGVQAGFSAQLLEGGDAFDQWTGDIETWQSPENMWISVTMNKNRSVTANFAPGDWTLTLNKTGASTGNTYPTPGTYAYLDGRTANLSANSNTSAYFAGWSGDVTSYSPYIEVTMDSNKSIAADFASAGYALDVTTNGNGWTNISGTQYFAAGTEPVLTATSEYGYSFDQWTGDVPAGVDPTEPSIPMLMDQNRTLTANFIINQKHLTLIIEGEGATTPAGAPDPGIQYHFNDGEVVYINADLGTNGWAFSHWSGEIGFANPSLWYIALTMNQDRTVVANYVPADWTLTIGYTGNGSTWPSPGSYGFVDGAIHEVVANIFAGGDAFDHWTGLPAGTDNTEIGVDLVFHSDYNVSAIFGPGDYTLTTAVAGDGDAEYLSHPAGIYQYKAGRYAHLEIRPWSTTYWGGFSGDLNSFDTFHRLLMDGDKSVTYNLGTSGYELVVNQTGGGRTDPSGTIRYIAGATPAIHALDTGSNLFDRWTGELSPGVDPYDRDPVIVLDQNRTITANFQEADWYLYTQIIGNGSIDPAPGLFWYLDGASFDLTATPGPDNMFHHWQGDLPEGQDPAETTIAGVMTQNREIIAVFVPNTVAVPDLTGKTLEQAEAMLAVIGLSVSTTTEEYSATIPAGQIISQDPAAETTVPYGSTLSLTISLGPCYASVINVTGMSQGEAETALTGANLTLGTVTEEYSDLAPEGQIISQNPVAGLLIECGDPVNIVLSLGIAGEGEGQEEGEGEGEGSVTEPHTADQDSNNIISLSELLRVIQFFNSGGLHCQAGTEDGYAPGTGDQSCAAHTSDYNPQDWQIGLSELLRLIQFFNSGGYHACMDGEDDFCPGLA